ncbi:hypothetical protein PPSIR1_24714 [Plesiocystis pacifica SIR-1]|uniref:Class I SAM-dependent methyltransferase n=1 Tax=Plesiocystis pacifica SIR-1 TaxID=391625 RepID=A6GB90_9BACT|nr:hypothetical protein [Plesiocystis pacifica]EDM76887.1 hypothetical protein PPSIR1_24714 [Plesiocystis pacifica SIR-1]
MAFVRALGRLVRSEPEPDLSTLPVWMDPIELSQVRAVIETLAPKRVLEWGAGGSTRELLATCPFIERYVSIEHNREWHGRVREIVKDPRLELHLVEPARPEPPLPGAGGKRPTTADRELLKAWRLEAEQNPELMADYVALPRTLDEHSFDFVLVDGRARSFCIREGFALLRPGGVVLLHDAQRPEYHEALRAVGRPVFLEPWKQGQVCFVRKPDAA